MIVHSLTYLALVGPTCVGKTTYAHAMIDEFPLDFVNVDSFQIYSFFRIGTGRADLQSDRAHLYGFQNPNEVLSAEDYLALIDGVLDKIFAQNRYPFFEGGSISYIRALVSRFNLKLIGLKPRNAEHALGLIQQRITTTSEERLLSEIAEGLRRGYGNNVIMRDDVVYLPYVKYLTGTISLDSARMRVRDNLFRRYQTQIEEYRSLPVEWLVPSADSLREIRDIVANFLKSQYRIG